MDYDRRHSPELAAAAAEFEQHEREGGMILVGDCPRCSHQMDFFVATEPSGSLLGTRIRGMSTRPDEPSEFEKTIVCNCEMPHDGRPEGDSGCGAMARILVGGAGGQE